LGRIWFDFETPCFYSSQWRLYPWKLLEITVLQIILSREQETKLWTVHHHHTTNIAFHSKSGKCTHKEAHEALPGISAPDLIAASKQSTNP
jgi:hypothetical protein